MKKITVLLSVAILSLSGIYTYSAHSEVKNPTPKADGRIVDNINLEFKDDQEVLGSWESVDFVKEISDFKVNTKFWKGDLFLKKLVFKINGELLLNDDSPRPWFKWTKGVVIHKNDKTASKYIIKNINNQEYMYFEWKSGDYIYKNMKPRYYVLKKSKV